MTHVNVWDMTWGVWKRFRAEHDTLVADAVAVAAQVQRER